MQREPVTITLEDGTRFRGRAFGSRALAVGELCFNTSMMGYTEIATDPSYAGQLVTFTQPHIGNVGVCSQDMESAKPWATALVVRDLCEVPSNHRSQESLDAFLQRFNVAGVTEVDTRALTTHLRENGAKMAIVHPDDLSHDQALKRLTQVSTYDSIDWVGAVGTKAPYVWNKSLEWGTPDTPQEHLGHVIAGATPNSRTVTVLDCGVKYSILRSLVSVGLNVRVVPPTTTANEILKDKPDAVILSNGPGDPARAGYVIESTKQLIGRVPLFGICLGHQMLALALGAKTYKLKYGHRGGNHPVMDIRRNRVTITSQNHGFAVDKESLLPLAAKDVHLSHRSLHDDTCEGLVSDSLRLGSVQFHPEASPGPLDAHVIFGDLLRWMEG